MIREAIPKRIVILALDASPHSLAALEAGAEVAVALNAELRGMFIEDENLLRTAELPIARSVARSGRVDLLDKEIMRRGLERHAEIARLALEAVAARMRLMWSFDIVRGSVAAKLLRAAPIADLVTLGRSGWSSRTSGLGSTTRLLLAECPSSLLFAEEGHKLGPPIAVVYDASDIARRALTLAASLVRNRTGQVIVIVEKDSQIDSVGEVEALLREFGVTGVRFQTLTRFDAHSLSEALRAAQTKGVLIPASSGIDIEEIARVVEQLRCPALVVR